MKTETLKPKVERAREKVLSRCGPYLYIQCLPPNQRFYIADFEIQCSNILKKLKKKHPKFANVYFDFKEKAKIQLDEVICARGLSNTARPVNLVGCYKRTTMVTISGDSQS